MTEATKHACIHFNEYSGLISFRKDWLDLLSVQGTLKSLLQHHSSKASILWCSAFFIVQLSHPYMTTGKTIALTRRTFVDRGAKNPKYSPLCCKLLEKTRASLETLTSKHSSLEEVVKMLLSQPPCWYPGCPGPQGGRGSADANALHRPWASPLFLLLTDRPGLRPLVGEQGPWTRCAHSSPAWLPSPPAGLSAPSPSFTTGTSQAAFLIGVKDVFCCTAHYKKPLKCH